MVVYLWQIRNELKDDEDREDELSKYEELAKEDKERYKKEMESYVPSEEEEEEEKEEEEQEKPKTKKTAKITLLLWYGFLAILN